MVKTTQDSQIKGKLHMNKLQELVDFISANFDKFENKKKQKEEKIKVLEDNNLKIHDKIAILEKKTDRQEQYSRRNCILLHRIPESD